MGNNEQVQQQLEIREDSTRAETQAAIEKFINETRFRPEIPYAGYGLECKCYHCNYCSCNDRIISNSLFLQNVYDVAIAVAKVMHICGIHQCKANAATDIIAEALLNYEQIRRRIDTEPKKRVRKLDFIHDLGTKCLMTLTEAQLSYAIIKRAFKAFYHGTSCNLKTVKPDRQVMHEEECFWVHAAKRTAQIFASYECLFLSARHNYEFQIRKVYKELLDRLQNRTFMKRLEHTCTCVRCPHRFPTDKPDPRVVIVKRSDMMVTNETKDIPIMKGECMEELPAAVTCGVRCKETEEKMDETIQHKLDAAKRSTSHISLNLPHCYKCQCPKLICDCEVDRLTGALTSECSQGPYVCRWVRVDESDEEPEPCEPYPEDHVCPIDCDATSIECDECICEESCICCYEAESDDEIESESFDWKHFDMESDYMTGESEELANACDCPYVNTPCI